MTVDCAHGCVDDCVGDCNGVVLMGVNDWDEEVDTVTTVALIIMWSNDLHKINARAERSHGHFSRQCGFGPFRVPRS
jgi:hypothetical protein